ncbi:type VI secretion system-associated protein TagF [Massilia oculi]|uniref:Type VI secretion system-associated protein TagF n=1 Tax=Massilia hydrophila TaxID=3044279 RepID=A0ABS7Y9H9_9BURK|nr:type VI secretion system-associated protein TagF [Massilia oculi]MCA1856352.1 type VI secretion system-associated protein TagF [Massilia oculi]
MEQAPGFFGKLPSHGDFIWRRLAPEVRACFDDWLQGALVQSKRDLGSAWLQTWLHSPLWRYLAAPGICGDQPWAGVMMPSHDRVGRCFPLLLAAPLDGMPVLRDCFGRYDPWFAQLENLALSALADGFSVSRFDAALKTMDEVPPGGGSPGCPPGQGCPISRPSVQPWEAFRESTGVSLGGKSAWWTLGSPSMAPRLFIHDGLPGVERFSAMLDAHWEG